MLAKDEGGTWWELVALLLCYFLSPSLENLILDQKYFSNSTIQSNIISQGVCKCDYREQRECNMIPNKSKWSGSQITIGLWTFLGTICLPLIPRRKVQSLHNFQRSVVAPTLYIIQFYQSESQLYSIARHVLIRADYCISEQTVDSSILLGPG